MALLLKVKEKYMKQPAAILILPVLLDEEQSLQYSNIISMKHGRKEEPGPDVLVLFLFVCLFVFFFFIYIYSFYNVKFSKIGAQKKRTKDKHNNHIIQNFKIKISQLLMCYCLGVLFYTINTGT